MIEKQERPLSNDEYRMLHQVRQFPRAVHREDGNSKLVHDEQQKEQALADGWSLEAFVQPPAPIALSTEDTLEALAEKVEELTERLQLAEEKLAALKPSVFAK